MADRIEGDERTLADDNLPVNIEQVHAEQRVGPLRIGIAAIAAIFIVAVVLYGLNNQRQETGSAQNPAGQVTAQGGPQQTTQPQPGNAKANPSNGSAQQAQQQPATPSQNAAKPAGAANPPATTGSGH